jgi:hypothetical protein
MPLPIPAFELAPIVLTLVAYLKRKTKRQTTTHTTGDVSREVCIQKLITGK